MSVIKVKFLIHQSSKFSIVTNFIMFDLVISRLSARAEWEWTTSRYVCICTLLSQFKLGELSTLIDFELRLGIFRLRLPSLTLTESLVSVYLLLHLTY